MSSDPKSPPANVTALLKAWAGGDLAALDALVPLVERELHRVARHHMRGERPGHTLQPTALVNEVYLRLAEIGGLEWRDRTHFLSMAARLMRRILVDMARARAAEKRGGGVTLVPVDGRDLAAPADAPDVVALHDALEALAQVDARKARVVELRAFGGLTVDETADVLGVSAETVMRDWTFAKAWLVRELRG